MRRRVVPRCEELISPLVPSMCDVAEPIQFIRRIGITGNFLLLFLPVCHACLSVG